MLFFLRKNGLVKSKKENNHEKERNEKLVIDVESYLQDGVEVDILLVFNAKKEKRTSRKISEKVRADETVSLEVFEGDVLHAVVTGTKEIVAKFDVQKDQLYYKISDQP